MRIEQYAAKVDDFIPLTYIEVIKDKPLIIKLSGKYNFVTWLQKGPNFIQFWMYKAQIIEELERLANDKPRKEEKKILKSVELLRCIQQMIELLYVISYKEYEKGFFKKRNVTKYRRFLYKFLSDNTDVLWDIWSKVLDYNTRLEKKNKGVSELSVDTTKRSISETWRGFLSGRPERHIRAFSFLRFLHEADEQRIGAREAKDAEKEKHKVNMPFKRT